MRDETKYTRVTKILQMFCDFSNVHPDVLKNAQNRGIYVHEKCDAIMSNLGRHAVHESWDKYVDSFEKWLPKRFIDKPKRFFCDDLMLTGECDGIYEDDCGLVLVDLKTSSSESKTWVLQGSAYSYLAEKAGYKIARIEFVKLSKEGKSPKVFIYKEDFEMFKKCLDAYRYFNKDGEKESVLEYI